MEKTDNKFWNELSKSSKEEILKHYQDLKETKKKLHPTELFAINTRAKIELLEELFDFENLNVEILPKVWDDIKDEKLIAEAKSLENAIQSHHIAAPDKLRKKLIASFKIYHLIKLGYGGLIIDDNWTPEDKYYITCNDDDNLEIDYGFKTNYFIGFHTREQAEEFLKNNIGLLDDYFMI